MSDEGDGWWRCSASRSLSGTADYLYVLQADSDGTTAATANGTDGLYVWGLQLNTNSLKTYQATTSSALTGDVNVVNWYDQNGGEDFNQVTGEDQPRIVMGSELVTDSAGKASIYFDAADHLDNNSLKGYESFDSFYVLDSTDDEYALPAGVNGTYDAGLLVDDGGTSNLPSHVYYGTAESKYFINGVALSTNTRDGIYEQSKGHSVVSHQNVNTRSWTSFQVGTWGPFTDWDFTGKISEMVFYPNMDASTKRFEVEQNQIQFFKTTLAQANFEANASAFGPSNALGATATITHETTDPLTGSGSMKLTISGNAGATSYPRIYGNNVGVDNLFLPADPVIGEKYKITMTTKMISGEVEMIGIGFGDQGGGGSPGEVSATNVLFSGTQTHVFEKTLTSVAGSSAGRLHIPFNGERTGVVLIDSIKVEKTGVQGFVSELFDQTGNGLTLDQSVAADQPKIVEGGDVCTLNSKPTMRFNSSHLTSGLMGGPALTNTTSNPMAIALVTRPNLDANDWGYIFDAGIDGTGASGRQLVGVNADEKFQMFAGSGWANQTAAGSTTGANLIWGHYADGESHLDLNGTVDTGPEGGGSGALTSIGLGARNNNTVNYSGDLSEFIIWPHDMESDKADAKVNINSHYNIY